MCLSNRMQCSIASSSSRRAIRSGNDRSERHFVRSATSISGNHVLLASPAGIPLHSKAVQSAGGIVQYRHHNLAVYLVSVKWQHV
jgi:hypothetical protein